MRHSADAARQAADQLREALASNYLRNKASGDNYGQITVSVGVSRFRAADTAEGFVSRADAALYEARAPAATAWSRKRLRASDAPA